MDVTNDQIFRVTTRTIRGHWPNDVLFRTGEVVHCIYDIGVIWLAKPIGSSDTPLMLPKSDCRELTKEEKNNIIEAKMRQIIIAAVNGVIKDLTDQELAALNIVAQANQDPRGRIFDYEKVEALFTENGNMHEETKNALAAIVIKRMEATNDQISNNCNRETG